MADDGKPYNEHDDRVGFPQRRKKGRGPFRWKYGDGPRRSGRGGAGLRVASRLEDEDRDVAMSDAQDGPRVRYNPYTARPNRRGGDAWHDRDRIHVTVRRDRAPPDRGGAGTSQDGVTRNWFKITVEWLEGFPRPGAPGYVHHSGTCLSVENQNLLTSLWVWQGPQRQTQVEGVCPECSTASFRVPYRVSPAQGCKY